MTEDGNIRGGKNFTKASLHGLLKNAIYTGMVNHKGSLYPGEHEAIVEQTVWDRVQTTLHRNGRGNGGGMKNKYGALLRGILSCGSCGAAMVHTYTMRHAKRYRYYVCYNAEQRGWDHCETKSVSAQAIETAVLDSIRRLGGDPELAKAVAENATAQADRRRNELEKERVASGRSLQRIQRDLAKAAADTKLTPADRAGLLIRLQDELEATEQRLADIADQLVALDRDTVDVAEVRSALENFVFVYRVRLLLNRCRAAGASG